MKENFPEVWSKMYLKVVESPNGDEKVIAAIKGAVLNRIDFYVGLYIKVSVYQQAKKSGFTPKAYLLKMGYKGAKQLEGKMTKDIAKRLGVNDEE